MKKILYVVISIFILILIIINISIFHKKNCLKQMQSNYSFIINKKIEFAPLDSITQNANSTHNHILTIVSPTCEDCYVKINRWNTIVQRDKRFQNRVYFLVTGNEFERLNELVKEKNNLKFIYDYENTFFKQNPNCLPSLTYLLGEKNNVILCGMPLENKTTMNIFIDNLN